MENIRKTRNNMPNSPATIPCKELFKINPAKPKSVKKKRRKNGSTLETGKPDKEKTYDGGKAWVKKRSKIAARIPRSSSVTDRLFLCICVV